jgi:hypothetical protein
MVNEFGCWGGIGHISRQRSHVRFEQVEKDERLEPLTQVRRTHQTSDWTMAISARAIHDLARRRWNGC